MTIQKILLKHEPTKQGLLGAAREIQENFGYVSPDAIESMAKYFHLRPAAVFSAVSFYGEIETKQPPYLIVKVCDGSNCLGTQSERVLREVESFFRQKAGDDSSGKVRIQRESCLGLCGQGPIMVVNGNVFERVRPEIVDDILRNYV